MLANVSAAVTRLPGHEAEEQVDHSDQERLDLLAFLADRLKVHLREQGARHDLIDAVFASARLPPP